MHLSLTFLPLLGLSLCAQAQTLNATGLISALEAAGLTALANATALANQTKTGQDLIAALVDGSHNYTVFAPNNAAFNAPAVAAIKNPDQIATILSYHVLPGTFTNTTGNTTILDSSSFPAVTVGRTMLTNSTEVHLEGNKAQVVIWSRNATGAGNTSIFFLNQSPEISVLSTNLFDNIFVATISGVLTPPGSLTEVVKVSNLTALAGVVGEVTVPNFFPNGTNATIIEALEANATRGFTLFAPNDEALKDADAALKGLLSNQTELLALLGNHYINGTSAYSPTLLDSNSTFISASGEPFQFASNSSGAYVTSGNAGGATAKIVKSDVLVENGVVHVIDRVLVNLDKDEAKAESAFESATSVAAQSATETGPVGPAATTSKSGGKKNGAVRAVGSGTVGWGTLFVVGVLHVVV